MCTRKGKFFTVSVHRRELKNPLVSCAYWAW